MPTPGPSKKPLMRCLGEFVGHVVHGLKTPAHERRTLRHDVQEASLQTPQGRAVLRRTTIEEIEIHPPPPPAP